MKTFTYTLTSLLLMSCGMLTSCLDEGDGTILVTQENRTGIPDDSQAEPNPEILNNTTRIPNVQHMTVDEHGVAVVRLDMTGVQDPMTGEWIRLFGTGSSEQNVWVEVDGVPKGISVYNTADDDTEDRIPVIDLVFLVDNSGSMSEEADAIARDIISWSDLLVTSGLDVRFGCVGYDGEITGAIDLTTAEKLSEYLERGYGTSRTRGFGGPNSSLLQQLASNYYLNSWSDECGVAALRMANDNFSFRHGANRVYVNFTDEGNYSGGRSDFSVEYVNNANNWSTENGTVHTVFSDNPAYCYNEAPWLLSEYTGGTIIYANSSFSDVSLATLPVTGAMQNSYIIRFTNIEELIDGETHTIHITVRSKDGSIRSERFFTVIFSPITTNQEDEN